LCNGHVNLDDCWTEDLRKTESHGRVFEDLESPEVLLFKVELPLL
jgi:hypothetical protein